MPSQFTDSISAIMLHCNRRKPGQCLDNFSNFTLNMFVQLAQCLKITKNVSKIVEMKGHLNLLILVFLTRKFKCITKLKLEMRLFG